MGGPHERKRWFLLAYDSERKGKNNSFNEFQKNNKEFPNNKEIFKIKSEFFNSDPISIRLYKDGLRTVPVVSGKHFASNNVIIYQDTKGNIKQKNKNIFTSWNRTFANWDGMDHGLSYKLDKNFWRVKKDFLHRKERLHALGNSVVPCVVKEAFVQFRFLMVLLPLAL